MFVLKYIAAGQELIPLKYKLLNINCDQIRIQFMRDTSLKDYYIPELSHPGANREVAIKAWTTLIGCTLGDVAMYRDSLTSSYSLKLAIKLL